MGYKISSLSSLPVIPGIDFYVFILGEYNWAGGYGQIIEDNFSKLAKNLGEKAAIIAGHDGVSLAQELPPLLSRIALKNRNVRDFVEKGESMGLSILLLGAHPSELKEDDLILLAPVEQIAESFGSLEKFFDELCSCAEERDVSFLKKFESVTGRDSGISKYLHLKPNMFGIGLNVNAMIDRWRSCGEERAV